VNTRSLPGQAAIPWRKELAANETGVRGWAESLKPFEATAVGEQGVDWSEALALIQIEQSLLGRRPEVRERVSSSIERGSIGQKLKRASGFKCQLCEALGLNPIGFLKANNEPYVEAHHATPVSALEVGSLSASNIMILCANHHRQMHYGTIELERDEQEFIVKLDGEAVRIKRFAI
jgi:predicted restriction endonuclease